MPRTIITPTPEPPPWAAGDQILSALWENSLAWRIEMIQAGDDPDRQDQVRRLAYEHDTAKATITVAEAERRWGRQNLRQNARGRLVMWQSEPGSPWLTTTYAMRAIFGPEPTKEE